MRRSLQLREQRNALVSQIRALADRQAEWTAEDEANWETVNKDYDALSRQIEVAERAETLEAEQAAGAASRAGQQPGRENRSGHPDAQELDDREQGPPTDEQRALALQAWCRAQMGRSLSDAHRQAAQRCGINPRRRSLDIALRRDYANVRQESRGTGPLTTQTAGTGGNLIPQGFLPRLERALLQFGGVRQVAEVMRTDTGADLPWPTANDTGNTGELLGENSEVAYTDASFGLITFKAFKFSSKLVKVPTELLQDSAFDLANVLGDMLGERLGRIQNTYFTTGDGTTGPQGIVSGSVAGKTTASATAIAAEELMDLVHSVDPAYRDTGCGWMFHDNILLALRKLKDGEGRYLWQQGLGAGQPDRLLDYPITINQSMASSITNNAKTALFGQLSKQKIRDVATIRLRRLVERYAEYDQEGFVAFLRSDSRTGDAGTNPIKHLLQRA